MPEFQVREFKLGGSKGDGLHPYLNDEGVFHGRAVPLLEKDGLGRWQPRPQTVLEVLFDLGYGVRLDVGRRMTRLASVARAMNRGDRCLAAISLVHMELPALPGQARARLMAHADELLKFNPSEPRVPAGSRDGGEWTSDGGAEPAVTEPPVALEYRTGNHCAFINAVYPGVSAAAKRLGIDETWLLGLGALESGWLDPHNRRLNNPFGLTHAGGANLRFDRGRGIVLGAHLRAYNQGSDKLARFPGASSAGRVQ